MIPFYHNFYKKQYCAKKQTERFFTFPSENTFFQLFCVGSANRANTCAGTAIDAFVGIDNVFSIAFGNCFNGAFCFASAAHDAFIGNFVSHK